MIDLVELPGGVSVSEVARPAAQEAVDVLHDVFNRYEQPAPVRDLTDAVAGAWDGLPRGAAGEEAQVPRAGSVAALAADGRIPLDVATPTRFGGCDAETDDGGPRVGVHAEKQQRYLAADRAGGSTTRRRAGWWGSTARPAPGGGTAGRSEIPSGALALSAGESQGRQDRGACGISQSTNGSGSLTCSPRGMTVRGIAAELGRAPVDDQP